MKTGTSPGLLPLVAAGLAVASLALVVGGRDRPAAPDIVAADKVGATYFSEVASFKARVVRALARHRGAHAAELRDIVDRQLRSTPTLGPPPPGAEKSRTYQAAVKARPTIFAPVTTLRARLDAAAQAEAFVKGADDALDRAAANLLTAAFVIGVETIEDITLPAVRKARDDFRRLVVPPDGRAAARVVEATLSLAVRKLQAMISAADSGDSYSFDLTKQFDAAEQALHDYAVVTDGNLAEAVSRLRNSA